MCNPTPADILAWVRQALKTQVELAAIDRRHLDPQQTEDMVRLALEVHLHG